MIWTILGGLALASWIYLAFGRGFFWLGRERDDRNEPPEPAAWPSVWAVVPARDEADVIARSIGSLAVQDYPGTFQIVLIDDQSSDGTAQVAAAAADARLSVISGAPLPAG
jgi:cellulose synthase/poly-beta-1,6-N-acetylglucosamine synthase-like glycosyltransferase